MWNITNGILTGIQYHIEEHDNAKKSIGILVQFETIRWIIVKVKK
jgi:hypothetical protein